MKLIALLLPLVAAPAAFLANDAPEPPEPYLVRLDGLTESGVERVESALAKVAGVASVEVDVERSVALLSTRDEALLARPMIDAALDGAGVTTSAFEEPRWSQIDVYVVEAEGGAWGAAKQAREAYTSLDIYDTLLIGGRTAVFTLSEGEHFDEAVFAKALEDQKLALRSFSKERRSRPAAAYVAKTKPVTWAATAGGVRATLLSSGLFQDAIVGDELILHVTAPGTLDVDAATKVLADAKIEIDGFERVDSKRF